MVVWRPGKAAKLSQAYGVIPAIAGDPCRIKEADILYGPQRKDCCILTMEEGVYAGQDVVVETKWLLARAEAPESGIRRKSS